MPKGKYQRITSAQRIEHARQIEAYRAEHPGRGNITAAFKALGIPGGRTTIKNYKRWREAMLAADTAPKSNGKDKIEVQHFPIEAIPDKPTKSAKPLTLPMRRLKLAPAAQHDEDKAIAASLLEVAIRLLKR